LLFEKKMEAQIYSFSKQIKEKLAKLFKLLDNCEGRRKILEQENATLKEEIKRHEATIVQLEANKFDDSVNFFNKKVGNDEVRKEMIGTIDEAIRAIDKTIDSLTRK